MITLTVTSFNGAPSDIPLSASFDELGGTIGRADTNQLVLPDPDRAISRVHAQIVFRAGGFAVVDRGSNPILVNGKAVGSGREAPVADGDQLQIGGYVLAIKRSATTAKSTPDDPFADLLGPAAASRGPAAAQAPAARTPGLVDPLAAFGFEPTPQTSPGIYSRPPVAAPAAAPSAGGIPDDWDPFAPDPVAARPSAQDLARSLGSGGNFGLDAGAAAPSALIPDLPASGPGNDNSLDNLFGLKPGMGGDPLANSALDAPMAKPNMAASHDPLASLNSAPKASAASASDAFSDLNRPFVPPPAIGAKPVAPPPPPVELIPPLTDIKPALPSGAVLSWDAPSGDGHTVIRPAAKADAAPAAAKPPTPAKPAAKPGDYAPTGMARPAAPPAAPVAARPPHASAGAGNADELLAAFREGLATPTVQVDALTPELMKLIGQLIHESAKGTVDLLVARAALKREVRAEATMIVARENNPLKFSPSVEAALQHLLSPPTRGFMPAAPAMRDAYDDLRAHQFGFIAGMRAALEGVLARFDPAELEGRLSQRSGLMSILPGSRKARMWEVFIEHYAQIRSDASDDFHTLFGKAFLEAYEEHIDQLKGDSP
ncbi:MAG: type VI secretion system-associated FHA domain protein TagH [Burkholderiaceae bacterium]|nr:type VI secretion system-associated FHA domain protein TagH [Burkholderiaceae bacterium]